MSDLRYAIRNLRAAPGFTAVALLTLGLGIGINVSIFSVADGVLLRPLPYPNPDRIVLLDRQFKGNVVGPSITAEQFRFWSGAKSFEAVEGHVVSGSGVNFASGSGQPERLSSISVTAGFFRVLGVEPMLGRGFTEEEDPAGGPCVAVVTHGFWTQRFASDPGAAGRPIRLNGEACTVTGVLPPTFRFHVNADVFTPLRLTNAPRDNNHSYHMLARLRPGVSIEQAREELKGVFDRFAAVNPDLVNGGEIGIRATRYLDWMVGDVRPAMGILMGAVGLVLLIACANVANLLLSRATGRSRELAVRAALGASRGRLTRQLMVESIVLGLAGGLAGLEIANWSVPVLLRLAPADLPRAADIAVDWRTFAFSLVLALLTGMLSGLFPALRSSRADLNQALKEGSRSSGGAARNRARGTLLAVEVALSVMLLAGAGLLIRSFVALRNVSLGFEPKGVATLRMSPNPRYSTTARMWDLERRALERMRAIPGVDSVSTASCLPLDPCSDLPTEIVGVAESEFEPQFRTVSPDYFAALSIPVLRGRAFTERDTASGTSVVVINQAVARRMFKNREPLGQRLLIGKGMGAIYSEPPRVVIGVVGDVRETAPDLPAELTVFVPRAQVPDSFTDLANRVMPMALAVRSKLPTLQIADQAAAVMRSLDAQQAVSAAQPLEASVAGSVAQRRFALVLMAAFAGIAMLLAAVGVYGVVSYQVSLRSRELGIRVALGASRSEILRMVIGQGMRPVALGLAAGLAGALALTRLLNSLLYDVSPRDPWTLSSIVVLLAMVAGVACSAPARRAARVDPMEALRHE
jgi:predicted permease